MDMPKPGPEHARFKCFVGTWSGDEQLSESPWGPGGAAFGRMEIREACDGMAFVQEYSEEKEGKPCFRGHGVFTIDPANGDTLWWFFDSMGFPPDPPARGRWDGDVLTLEKTTPRGEARYRFTCADDHHEFRIENRFPGQAEFATFMHGRYRRER